MKYTQKRQKSQRGQSEYKAFIAKVREHLLPTNNIVNNKSLIPKWRDVTAIQKVVYYMIYMTVDNRYSVTIDFSESFREKFNRNSYKQLKDVIRRRLNENFKNNLGLIPFYAFIIENKNRDLHLHGIIELASHQVEEVKRVMKVTAFGVNYKTSPMKNHIIHVSRMYTPRRWLQYITKKPRTANLSLYISNGLLKKIKNDYCAL